MVQIRIDKCENGINCFTRFMSTIVTNSLFLRCFICSSQVRFSSMMTPKNFTLSAFFTFCPLRGKGGVPGGQIMENEFEYLTDRGGYGDHLAEKFLKKYCS